MEDVIYVNQFIQKANKDCNDQESFRCGKFTNWISFKFGARLSLPKTSKNPPLKNNRKSYD